MTIIKPQIIFHDGKPAYVLVPYDEYAKLVHEPASAMDNANMTDEELFDLAKKADEEAFPAEVLDQLLAGVHPVKVYRKHRGLTQRALGKQTGYGAFYISQIENRRRCGSIMALSRLATALGADIDDLLDRHLPDENGHE